MPDKQVTFPTFSQSDPILICSNQNALFYTLKLIKEILAVCVLELENIALAYINCPILGTLSHSNGKLWIPLSNIEFVPQPLIHKDSVQFSFLANRILGAFEHFKWLQVFDIRELHTIAALDNLNLMLNNSIYKFFLVNAKKTLSEFVNQQIPWFDINSKHFNVVLYLL